MKHKIYKVNFLTKFLIVSISVLVATLFSLSLFWNSGNAIADDEVEDVANEVAADVPEEIPENVPANAMPIMHMPDAPGSYFLISDIYINSTWTTPHGDTAETSVTTIDLNGHSIYSYTPIAGPMIYVDAEGTVATLNIINTNYFEKSYIFGGNNTNDESTDFYGGAINNSGFTRISNVTISNCHSRIGGAIFSIGELDAWNCEICNNSAVMGAGIHCSSATSLENCSIHDNFASDSGGGMYVASGVAEINFCDINSNTALFGGGIYNNVGILILNGSQLNENSALVKLFDEEGEDESGSGGAIYNFLGSVEIYWCNFISNYAGLSGGAIYGINYMGWIVENTTFSNNLCMENGGAIDFEVSLGPESENGLYNVPITSCNFYNNCAKNGGAIYYKFHVSNIKFCSFENNSAEIGGAIYYIGLADTGVLDYTIFNENYAKYGAAVFSAFVTINAEGLTVTNNHTLRSGTIFATFASYNISNSLISGNFADTCSAANFTAADFHLTYSTIKDNCAWTFCGGIYAGLTPIDMPDIELLNEAKDVNADDDSIILVQDSAIYDNYGEGLVLQHLSQKFDGTVSIYNNSSHSWLYTDVSTSQNRNSNLLLLEGTAFFDPVVKIGENFRTYIPIGFNIAKLDITDEGWIKLSHIEKCLTDGYSAVRGDAYITKDFVYEGYNGMQVWGDSVTGGTSKEIWVDRDHKHHVMYWNDDNTLFAWCTDKDCAHHDIFTALKTTINADDAIWDGNAHGAEINDEIFRTFFWSDTPLVKYVNTDVEGAESSYYAPTEAGEYSAFLDTWFVPSISDSFIIHHENLESWMLDPQEVTMSYNGEEQSPVFTLKDGSRDIFENVELSGDLSATEIGDYQIVITGKDDNIKYGGQIVLNWHITGDPQPVPPTPVDPDNPGGGGSAQTSDSAGIVLAIASMLALCGASAAGACAKRRKFDK